MDKAIEQVVASAVMSDAALAGWLEQLAKSKHMADMPCTQLLLNEAARRLEDRNNGV